MPADKPVLNMRFLPAEYSIHRLAPGQAPPQQRHPAAADSQTLRCVLQCTDEITVVCPSQELVIAAETEAHWRILKLDGPFEFSQTGILAAVAQTLAEGGVSIFALSSWATDYILVRSPQRQLAQNLLVKQGHHFPAEP